MARALTTSEANQRLIQLGYLSDRGNRIEDNDFTKPFGTTDYYIQETTNMFDKENKYRWWDNIGTMFYLNIKEYRDGTSYLTIDKTIGHSGRVVVNYAKLKAADKKKFMAIFEELSTKRDEIDLPNTNHKPTVIWGNAYPTKIVELNQETD